MNNFEIGLSEEGKQNIEETLNVLMESMSGIAEMTEKDFDSVKNTKWYKRLWQLITFSKENEKVLAKGVGNLAKLQEILMKAILLVSKQNAEASALILDNVSKIESLSANTKEIQKIQNILIAKILRIKSGIRDELKLDQLQIDDRILFISALDYEIKNNNETKSNQDAQNFFANLIRVTGMPQDNINLDCIGELDRNKTFLLYRILLEYNMLQRKEPEISSDIKDYLSINNKDRSAIKRSVEAVFENGGPKAIIQYYLPSEEDDLSIYDDYIEFEADEAEDKYSEDSEMKEQSESMEIIDTTVSRDEYTISSILNIPDDQKLVIENKNVHINAFINCSGTLVFKNCYITYNETLQKDEITLNGEARLYILSSTIRCTSYDKTFFISGKASDVEIDNCLFVDCTNFIGSLQCDNFMFLNNESYNCYYDFINVDSNTKTKIIKNKWIYTRVPDYLASAEFRPFSQHTSIRCGGKGDVSLFLNYFTALLNDEELEKLRMNIIHADTAIVAYCTFENLANCIEYPFVIMRSIFRNCRNVLHHTPWKSQTLVEDCLFDSCSDVCQSLGGDGDESIIEKCQFIQCKEELIYSDGLIKIQANEFINCSTMNRSLIKINFQGKENAKRNRKSIVNKCIFDGISLENRNYIISTGNTEMKYLIGSVENCGFYNCKTVNPDGLINDTCVEYHTIGKPTIKQTLNCYNNSGIDQSNQGESMISTSSSRQLKQYDEDGNSIGCGYSDNKDMAYYDANIEAIKYDKLRSDLLPRYNDIEPSWMEVLG